jgi:plasmid maintenance system antidote protein VapI
MSARHESHIAIDGTKLLAQMNRRGLSAAQLAKAAHVSPGTISGLMGGRTITPRTARRISAVLWSHQPVPGLADILQLEEA